MPDLPANIIYHNRPPDPELAGFVKYYWYLSNPDKETKEFAILPDGHFDILFRSIDGGPFKGALTGLWTQPIDCVAEGNSRCVAISFKLLAMEHIVQTNIASLVNGEMPLPDGFWGITDSDCANPDTFIGKASQKMIDILRTGRPDTIDNRQRELFDLLYSTAGAITVKEIADTVHWSSRQINRYFTDRFGITLKAYCNILRYRASFGQLKKGKLYPEQEYFDQAHFIRDVKKYSGATPSDLAANKNDRFIQLSTLPDK